MSDSAEEYSDVDLDVVPFNCDEPEVRQTWANLAPFPNGGEVFDEIIQLVQQEDTEKSVILASLPDSVSDPKEYVAAIRESGEAGELITPVMIGIVSLNEYIRAMPSLGDGSHPIQEFVKAVRDCLEGRGHQLQLDLIPRQNHDVGLIIVACEATMPTTSFIAEALSVACLSESGEPRFPVTMVAVMGRKDIQNDETIKKMEGGKLCAGDAEEGPSGLLFLRDNDNEEAINNAMIDLTLVPERECDILFPGALGLVAVPFDVKSEASPSLPLFSEPSTVVAIFTGDQLLQDCQQLILLMTDDSPDSDAQNEQPSENADNGKN